MSVNLSPPRIEKIILSPEEQKKIDKIQSARDLRPLTKNAAIHRICGFCLCGNIPEMKLIIDLGGACRIEKYCSSCLEKERERELAREQRT